MCAEYRLFLPWFALYSFGCGSLVGTDYRGEVLLRLTGQVRYDGSLEFDSDIGVTLLWSLNLDEAADQQAVVAKTTFPARYTLEIYHPPRAKAFQSLFGEGWLKAAVGQPILYEDNDGDGLWDQQHERVVGGAFNRAIVWIEDLGPSPERLGGWIPERTGFHVVDVLRQPCIETGLEELPLFPAEGVTDLEIGYNWQALNDWDCDGEEDWDPDDDWPQPLTECAEIEQYEPLCEEYRLALDVPGVVDAYRAELAEDPLLFECLLGVCPEVVTELMEGESGCPEPSELGAYCAQIEAQGADPVIGPALRDQIANDGSLASCLREECDELVDWLYSEPWSS